MMPPTVHHTNKLRFAVQFGYKLCSLWCEFPSWLPIGFSVITLYYTTIGQFPGMVVISTFRLFYVSHIHTNSKEPQIKTKDRSWDTVVSVSTVEWLMMDSVPNVYDQPNFESLMPYSLQCNEFDWRTTGNVCNSAGQTLQNDDRAPYTPHFFSHVAVQFAAWIENTLYTLKGNKGITTLLIPLPINYSHSIEQ